MEIVTVIIQIMCFPFYRYPGKCLCVPVFHLWTEPTVVSTSSECLCTVCEYTHADVSSEHVCKNVNHEIPNFITPLFLSPFIGESGQSCVLLPGAAFQQSHVVPVRGDVRVCARWLQPSGGARPGLGGTSREGEAAAGVPGESHRTHAEQGRSFSRFVFWKKAQLLLPVSGQDMHGKYYFFYHTDSINKIYQIHQWMC